ncbi:MAG: putative response regulator, CheY [Verrucomicrobiales bacterium]|nr:putative response regulator, CheY [Verrucomicrobiales bacterium]MDB6129699.1 putative response regulator, CheY [Verrucomicrobiales bacterium]
MSSEKTILIAEDSEQDLQMLLRAFQSAGVQNPVQVVPDGLEAIRYLSGEGPYANREKYPFPAILLLDLNMPKQDGFAVLSFLEERSIGSKLLKIVLTGLSDRKLIDKAYRLGANSFLHKPTRSEDLQNLVHFFKEYWLILNRLPGPANASPRQHLGDF